MDAARGVVSATVAVILLSTLASGPLVGAVDFTPEPEGPTDEAALGTGSVAVSVRSIPDRARLERGDFAAGAYYLEVPDAILSIESVTGRPMVVYKVLIHQLGYTQGTTHFLRNGDQGRKIMSLEPEPIPPDRVTGRTYEGEIMVVRRANGTETVLRRRTITVKVRG